MMPAMRIFLCLMSAAMLLFSDSISSSFAEPDKPVLPDGMQYPEKERYEAGLKKWEQLKKKCKGNYSYEVRWSSFSGFGHTTTIAVKNNKVVRRDYEEFNLRAPIPGEAPQQGKKWTETGKQIGKHKEGAPAKTLDEIYAEGKKVLMNKLEPHEKLYVRLDKNGLPTSCFYIDTRIADDAPRTGFLISNIKLDLPKK